VHAAARVNVTSLRTLPPTISAWQGIGLRRLLGITAQPREGRNCYAEAFRAIRVTVTARPLGVALLCPRKTKDEEKLKTLQ